jgi:hypothetical protein
VGKYPPSYRDNLSVGGLRVDKGDFGAPVKGLRWRKVGAPLGRIACKSHRCCIKGINTQRGQEEAPMPGTERQNASIRLWFQPIHDDVPYMWRERLRGVREKSHFKT